MSRARRKRPARADLNGGSEADLATFRSRALGAGFNLRNTVAPTRNPIENLAFQLQYVGSLQSFRDRRRGGRSPTRVLGERGRGCAAGQSVRQYRQTTPEIRDT